MCYFCILFLSWGFFNKCFNEVRVFKHVSQGFQPDTDADAKQFNRA